MTPQSIPKGKWSLALTGRLAQFNLSLLLVLLCLLAAFVMCLRSPIRAVSCGGALLVLLLISACVIFVIRHYSKQESRPSEGQTSSIEIQGLQGGKLTIKNPPDSFFAKEQTHALLRAFLLGYDDNLCPDGKVIGAAAEEHYEPYSDEDKTRFMTEHKAQIRGLRERAALLLTEGDDRNRGGNDNPAGERGQ
jgi:hypothetical protein